MLTVILGSVTSIATSAGPNFQEKSAGEKLMFVAIRLTLSVTQSPYKKGLVVWVDE